MSVVEDRTWARGLSQEAFEKEFVKRIPWADVIPDVNFYAEYVPRAREDCVVNPEDIRPELDGKVETDEREVINYNDTKKTFSCEFCGKAGITAKIGLISHQRHCKEKIKHG